MTSGTNTTALIDLNYSKAVTHRWSSGGEDAQSFNMQNMGRESGTRNIWIPDPGNVYVIVDLSQIEARVAAWYAGEKALLRAFSENRCVYCDFGKYVFGHVLDRGTEKSERQICKQAVLGLQFGMGANRFLQTLQAQASDHLKKATERLNTSSDEDTAKQVVGIYRKTYQSLAGLPSRTLKSFIETIIDPKVTGKTVGSLGKFRVRYNKSNRVLSVHPFPSGSPIYYRDVKVELVPSNSGRVPPSTR